MITNNMKNIKWACIQPLTGGFYLGAEAAIGHSAEWIMSFEGLSDYQISNKTGEMSSVGNEYNLLEYLRKHNRSVPYYIIHNGMFDININDEHPIISLNSNESIPNYNDLDIVIGLPVCSGLSMVTSASKETKQSRNGNMQWMSNYTLKVIKPKIFVFENAPTLMGSRGNELRSWFNELALSTGYSILYYKTDTILHNSCQKRPRTFVIFIKHNDNNRIQEPPSLSFSSITVPLKDYLNRLPDKCTQMESIPTGVHNKYVLDWINSKYGESWKNFINGSIMDWINKEKHIDELIKFVENNDKYTIEDKEKTLRYFNHIKYKKSLGLNYYGDDIQYLSDSIPSVQFRSMPNLLHVNENRTYTIREYLHFMGMPNDFELYGDISNFPKIGQNVPVNTAKFIVSECVKIINNWDNERGNEFNSKYQNNMKETIEKEES